MRAYRYTRKRLQVVAGYLADRLNQDFHSAIDQRPAPGDTPQRLEALLAAVFWFDYLLNARQVPEALREGFLSDAFQQISEQHKGQVASQDPLSTLEERFNGYADYAINKGEHWLDHFLPAFYEHLQGSHEYQQVQPAYELATPAGQRSWEPFQHAVRHSYQLADQLVAKILDQHPPKQAYKYAQQAVGEQPEETNRACLLRSLVGYTPVLVAFRAFRDRCLSPCPGGYAAIQQYYRISQRLLSHHRIS
jgi:hypothetical protein